MSHELFSVTNVRLEEMFRQYYMYSDRFSMFDIQPHHSMLPVVTGVHSFVFVGYVGKEPPLKRCA